MLPFLNYFIYILILFGCYESSYSDTLDTKVDRKPAFITLYDHLEAMVNHKSPYILNLDPLKSLLSQRNVKADLYKIPIQKDQIPELGTCCDWRHLCFNDDYTFIGKKSRKERQAQDYQAAAKIYCSIADVGNILKKHYGLLVAEAYIKCWFPRGESTLVIFKAQSNEFEHTKGQKSIKIKKVDEDLVYDIVFPGRRVPGIELSDKKFISNPYNLPVFIIRHSCIKGQSLNLQNDMHIEGMLLQSKICMCGSWVDWSPPDYSFPLIYSLLQEAPNLQPPFNQRFLALLSAAITDKNDLDSDNHLTSQIFFCVDSYNSGIQLLKDIWPGSNFSLRLIQPFEQSKFKPNPRFVKMQLDPDFNERFPITNALYKKLNIGEQYCDIFNIIRPLSIDKPPPLHETIFFSETYRRSLLISSTSQLKSRSKDILESISQSVTIINWRLSVLKEPVDTIKALITLCRIIGLQNQIDPSTGNFSSCDDVKGRLALLAHLYQHHSVSLRNKRIWLDAIKRKQCSFSFLPTFLGKSESFFNKHPGNVLSITPLHPFPVGVVTKGDFLYLFFALNNDSNSPGGVCLIANFISVLINDGVYIWEKQTEKTLPILLEASWSY